MTVFDVNLYESIHPAWTADSTAVTADSPYWTADGGPLEGAHDVTDAEVISISVPVGGGVYQPRRRPLPVVGYGYGVLPELEGEAHGTVIATGRGLGKPSLDGVIAGTAGACGRAIGSFKAVTIVGIGAAGTRGAASAAIVEIKGTAAGRHDDDEAAIITFLLAA